jgi:hypothetical protein
METIKHINKIFEIGLKKTGTTSLKTAFQVLNIPSVGWNEKKYNLWKRNGISEGFLNVINRKQAFSDGPWHDCDYRILDQKFPNSKFIILERNNDDWIRSKEKHESPLYNANDIGSDWLSKEWITDRENHIKRELMYKENKYNAIKEYFKDRPNDLLVMNICEGEGWEKLCPFLGVSMPNKPFPFTNRARKNYEIS